MRSWRSIATVVVWAAWMLPTTEATAVPCTSGSYAAYLGIVCEIDGLRLADFTAGPSFGYSPMIDPASIQVTPLVTPDGAALVLAIDQAVPPGCAVETMCDSIGIIVGFTASGIGRNRVAATSVLLTDSASTGSGSVLTQQYLCIGQAFEVPLAGCNSPEYTIINVGLSAPFGELALATPVHVLGATAVIDAGKRYLTDTAFLGSVTFGFVSVVPEPATLVLIVLAVIALCARRTSM